MFRRKNSQVKEVSEELSASVEHLRKAGSAAVDATTQALGDAKRAVTRRVGSGRDSAADASDKVADSAKDSWETTMAAVAPIVASAVALSQKGKKKVRNADRAARRAAKEAQRRSDAVARALRGERSSRWPLLLGAFAVGAAVGVLASLVARRAKDTEWEEFDLREEAHHAKDKVVDAASEVKGKAAQVRDNVRDRLSDGSESTRQDEFSGIGGYNNGRS